MDKGPTANHGHNLDTKTSPLVWYFAYGSNMRSSVMSSRGLHIAASQPVVVPSHILTFDVFGIPYTEPAMASITLRISSRPAEQLPDVHGAVYLLSHSDFARLVLSEGAGTAYREIEVEAHVLGPEQRVIKARTLVARYPFRPNALPSVRYMVRCGIPAGQMSGDFGVELLTTLRTC
jgi:gliotoxin/aspirochlorine biosynthesis gamma-glutamylcyclotransferase